MINLPDEEQLGPIRQLLSFVSEKDRDALSIRRQNWNTRNEELFKSNQRFSQIKRRMNDGAAFSSLGVDELCADMAFLASFYDHIVELEGLAVAERTIYTRYYQDNMSIVYAGRIFEGTKTEVESLVRLMIPEMKMMYDIVTNSEYDLALLGIKDTKQTSRSDSIKMMIEVYKKRHDSARQSTYVSSQRHQ